MLWLIDQKCSLQLSSHQLSAKATGCSATAEKQRIS